MAVPNMLTSPAISQYQTIHTSYVMITLTCLVPRTSLQIYKSFLENNNGWVNKSFRRCLMLITDIRSIILKDELKSRKTNLFKARIDP